MIGPNGAGKTTTIECCLGLRNPTSGSINLVGYNPRPHRSELFRDVGVQLQETSYQEHIQVRKICSLISPVYDNPRDWRELFARFGLKGREIQQLSDDGGTVFLTTHYMDEAEELCDRVAVIVNGKITALVLSFLYFFEMIL